MPSRVAAGPTQRSTVMPRAPSAEAIASTSFSQPLIPSRLTPISSAFPTMVPSSSARWAGARTRRPGRVAGDFDKSGAVGQ